MVEFSIEQTPKGEEARDVRVFQGEAKQTHPSETTTYASTGARVTGTVKKWISDKGYGFLQQDAGGPDLFVHIRSLGEGVESLAEGQKVEFQIAKSEKGEIAQNVTVCNEA